MERISRREFGKLIFLSAVSVLLHESCNREKPIPEIIVPNDQIRIIDNINDQSTKQVGIERMFVLHPRNTQEVIVFLDRSKDTVLTLKFIDRSRSPIKDGFVPFDPSFNVDDALKYLDKQYSLRRSRQLIPQEFAYYTALFGKFSQNPPGILANYDIPQTPASAMYVFGLDELYTINQQKPPAALLKVKFRFT